MSKTISVEAYVDLDDFDTDEIIKELDSRLKKSYGNKKMSNREKQELRESLQPLSDLLFDNPFEDIQVKTLDDQMKIEHLSSIFHKYTSAQLEKLIP